MFLLYLYISNSDSRVSYRTQTGSDIHAMQQTFSSSHRVVGEHGAALGREPVPPGRGGGGLDHPVEGDCVHLAGVHHVAGLEGLEQEEVELPVVQ